jgi:hypothetical protein
MPNSKIIKISRNKLDENKYNLCLHESINYVVYAEIWYLDILTNRNWYCYILGDYDAIMPVPFQFLFFIKVISLPTYIQQLGIFYGKDKISNASFQIFQKKIKSKIVRGYAYNEDNTLEYQPKGRLLCNQTIELNKEYTELIQDFRKDRIMEVRKYSNNFQIIELKETKEHFKIINEYSALNSVRNISQLKLLVKELSHQGTGLHIIGKINTTIIGSIYYIIHRNRIYQIASVRSHRISRRHTTALMINTILKKYSNTNFIYDFEGSDIKGVQDFNSSFGAKEKKYTYYSNIPIANKIINIIKSKL